MAEVSPSLSGELPVEASAIVHNYVSLEGLDENEVLISIDGVNSETVDYMKELVWANVSCDADKSYKLQTSITPRPSSL